MKKNRKEKKKETYKEKRKYQEGSTLAIENNIEPPTRSEKSKKTVAKSLISAVIKRDII